MTALLQSNQEIAYPYYCDGQPMSDNTEQYRWIVIIKENLEIMFAAIEKVFIAGDLFWSPVKGKVNTIKNAPDVMVVFGRSKGKRLSYIQHEEDNIAPQVTFEILSPGNSKKEMEDKFTFYQQYGVKEYYLYDPHKEKLEGWQRRGQNLEPILMMNDWVSPLLGIRFVMTTNGLEIYRPDGRKFLTSVELEQEREQQQQRAEQQQQRAEQQQQRAEQQQQRAIQAENQLEQARAELERAAAQLEQERQQRRQIAQHLSTLGPEQLRALGLDPEMLQ